MRVHQQLQLREVLDAIKKRIRLVLIITMISALTSGILSYYKLEPIYEARTSVLVGNSEGERITPSDVMLYQNLSKTYVEIAKSRLVAEIATKNLKDGTTISELQNSVDINELKGTQIITIDARADNAKGAADRANVFAEAFISESQRLLTCGRADIVDKALIPQYPIYENKLKNILIALAVGLFSSIILALFLEYLDNTIKNVEDVKKYVSIPVIGVIPKSEITGLIVKDEPECLATQAYKTLRTNMEFSYNDKKVKTILIASAGIGEGKSTVAANLALAISQLGKSVLLIDCDLRKPSLHQMFQVSNIKGTPEVLQGISNIKDNIVSISEKLDILTGGFSKTNPSELLSSQKVDRFIKEFESKYDNIIIDSPAVLSVTDAQVLSTKVSGVLYVIGSQQTSIEGIKKSIELLNTVNANIIGVVLNKTKNKSECLNGYFDDKNKKPKKEKGGKHYRGKEKSKSRIVIKIIKSQKDVDL